MKKFFLLLKNIPNIFLEDYNCWKLWYPVLIGIGVLLYFNLKDEPTITFVLPIVLLICVLWLVLPKMRILSSVLALICVGFIVTMLRVYFIGDHFITKSMYIKDVTAKLLEIRYKDGYKQFVLSDIEGLKYANGNMKKIRVAIRTKIEDKIEVGDIVKLSAKLRPPPSMVSPYSYNFAFFAYFNGISAVGYATSNISLVMKSSKLGFLDIVERYRNNMHNFFVSNIDKNNGEILSALILGKREGVDKSTMENIRNSGLAHLLAISGLHLAVVSVFFFNFMRRIFALLQHYSGIYFSSKKISAVFAIFITVLYLMIAGAPISAQRACIMLSFMFLGVILDREVFGLSFVAFAATVILIFTPEAILSPSFQMSFAAVIGLISSVDMVTNNNSRGVAKFSTFRYLHTVIMSSAVAGIFTLPYTAYNFNYFSLGGVFANLIAVPLVSFIILPLGVVCLLLMQIGIAGPALFIIDICIGIMTDVASFVASTKYSTQNIGMISGGSILIVTVGLLWFALWEHKWRFIGLPIVLFGFIIAALTKSPDVLVNETFAAVKGHDSGLYFLQNVRRNFTTESWSKLYLNRGIRKYEDYTQNSNESLKCSLGKRKSCKFRRGDKSVVFRLGSVGKVSSYKKGRKGRSSYYERVGINCKGADIVIYTDDYDDAECNTFAGITIRYADLVSNGTHAIWLDDQKIENVRDSIGNRPWGFRNDS